MTKDLKQVRGAELRNILIVDNTVTCFINYLNHGIPILPYTKKNPEDSELLKLADYLVWLYKFKPDMVLKNAEYFKLHMGLRAGNNVQAFEEIFKL